MYQLKFVSSLIKVFPDQEPQTGLTGTTLSALQNETLCLQAAYYGDGDLPHDILIECESDLTPHITLRSVQLMPSLYPLPARHDGHCLKAAPGMYPDLLKEIKDRKILVLPGQWSSIWVDINTTKEVCPGPHSLKLSLFQEDHQLLASAEINILILEACLKEQQLKHTEWFHADCLADFYHVDPWSEEHFSIVEQFLKVYGKRGMNTILTPVLTPPLDTAVGGIRTNVQLTDIYYRNDTYSFDFSKLERWVELCLKYGIRYFEMAHLYTQWGAKAAPAVYVHKDGELTKLFGWETAADDPAYVNFLSQFIPALIAFFKSKNLDKNLYFHISDEPSEEQIQGYLKAKEQIAPYVKGYPVIDALSHYPFYESGAVDHPIPANDCINEFLDKKVPGLWTYYCSAQNMNVSNRFFSTPLSRTRMIGVQLYKFQLEGFLHWGYNFYNSRFSEEHVNPYAVTDAGGYFPSGDSFLVYPGPNGTVLESVRLMSMLEAMQDVRAFQTLESYTSHEYVVSLIEEFAEGPISFSSYPKDDEYLLKLRERINREIEKHKINP